MRQRRMWTTGALLGATVAWAWVARAGLIPGGGPQPSDCYLELSVDGVDVPGPLVTSGRKLACTDGDACDADAACGNDSCTFRVAVCVGQTDPNLACTPPTALRRLRVNRKLEGALPATLDGSACGAFVDVIVPLRGKKKRAMLALSGNAVAERGSRPARDRDKFVLLCQRSVACLGGPTTTTTLPGLAATTVTVGPGGELRFDPQSLTVHVGETVRWHWASGGHSVVSGTPGNSDGRFCSTDDRGCGNAPVSGAGTSYDHTFTEAGTFQYFCGPHGSFGMTGRVIVQP